MSGNAQQKSHFHGPVSGLVHTGSGNIQVETLLATVQDLHLYAEDTYGLGKPKTFVIAERIDRKHVLQCVAGFLQQQHYAPPSFRQLPKPESIERAYYPWWIVECEVAINYVGVHKQTKSVPGPEGKRYNEEYEEKTSPPFRVRHYWPIYAGNVSSVELADLFKPGSLRIVYKWEGFILTRLWSFISTLLRTIQGNGSLLGSEDSVFKPHFPSRLPSFLSIASSGIPISKDPTFISHAQEVKDWTQIGEIVIGSSPRFAIEKAHNDITTFHLTQIRSRFHRLERFDSTINPISIALICLPLWHVTLKYRDHLYHIWLDGNNGEVVKAEVPVGNFRKAIESLMAAVPFGCLLLLNLFPLLMTGLPQPPEPLGNLVWLIYGLIVMIWGIPIGILLLSALWYGYYAWENHEIGL